MSIFKKLFLNQKPNNFLYIIEDFVDSFNECYENCQLKFVLSTNQTNFSQGIRKDLVLYTIIDDLEYVLPEYTVDHFIIDHKGIIKVPSYNYSYNYNFNYCNYSYDSNTSYLEVTEEILITRLKETIKTDWFKNIVSFYEKNLDDFEGINEDTCIQINKPEEIKLNPPTWSPTISGVNEIKPNYIPPINPDITPNIYPNITPTIIPSGPTINPPWGPNAGGSTWCATNENNVVNSANPMEDDRMDGDPPILL